jgi:hypothetical protein
MSAGRLLDELPYPPNLDLPKMFSPVIDGPDLDRLEIPPPDFNPRQRRDVPDRVTVLSDHDVILPIRTAPERGALEPSCFLSRPTGQDFGEIRSTESIPTPPIRSLRPRADAKKSPAAEGIKRGSKVKSRGDGR